MFSELSKTVSFDKASPKLGDFGKPFSCDSNDRLGINFHRFVIFKCIDYVGLHKVQLLVFNVYHTAHIMWVINCRDVMNDGPIEITRINDLAKTKLGRLRSGALEILIYYAFILQVQNSVLHFMPN